MMNRQAGTTDRHRGQQRSHKPTSGTTAAVCTPQRHKPHRESRTAPIWGFLFVCGKMCHGDTGTPQRAGNGSGHRWQKVSVQHQPSNFFLGMSGKDCIFATPKSTSDNHDRLLNDGNLPLYGGGTGNGHAATCRAEDTQAGAFV